MLPYAWDAAGWWSDDQVLNLAAIAAMANKTVTVRYSADNVPCSPGNRTDVLGMFLNN